MKTAVLTSKGPCGGGGGNGGTQSLDSGPLPLVRGPTYKKKVVQDLHLKQYAAATRHKEALTPPPPPPPKMGLPATGGGVQNRKIHWGIIFCPKMMILQGARHPMPYLGVQGRVRPT